MWKATGGGRRGQVTVFVPARRPVKDAHRVDDRFLGEKRRKLAVRSTTSQRRRRRAGLVDRRRIGVLNLTKAAFSGGPMSISFCPHCTNTLRSRRVSHDRSSALSLMLGSIHLGRCPGQRAASPGGDRRHERHPRDRLAGAVDRRRRERDSRYRRVAGAAGGRRPASEPEAGEPIEEAILPFEAEPHDELHFDEEAAPLAEIEHDDLAMQDHDTEVEDIGFATSEPRLSEAPVEWEAAEEPPIERDGGLRIRGTGRSAAGRGGGGRRVRARLRRGAGARRPADRGHRGDGSRRRCRFRFRRTARRRRDD